MLTLKTKREMDPKEQQELSTLFKDRVNFDKRERKIYSHDVASLPKLVKPENKSELVDLVPSTTAGDGNPSPLGGTS